MLVTGAGQISMAIARRIGFGKKIILGDKNIENANIIAKIMNEAGYREWFQLARLGLLGSGQERRPGLVSRKSLNNREKKGANT